MLETHPFGFFVPQSSRFLLLGSFTAKDASTNPRYNWYYANGRNQFWPILEEVYKRDLGTKLAKKRLFRELGIAIGDIIYQCTRKRNSSMDVVLVPTKYHTEEVAKVMARRPIEKVFFTSRFVEDKYRKHFKNISEKYPQVELITLPSPSPRYASMRFGEKVQVYKKLLPAIAR